MELITDVKRLQDIVQKVNKRTGKCKASVTYSDTIYTFDIEVSSLFKINGKWQRFDYNYDNDFYTTVDKASCVYISMFGINDNVYYFREFKFFKQILEKIADTECRKIIYIHNLSYEFQFLRMILKDYTIENMLANAPHKPISFYVKELNIEFRCSYKLTSLSLEKSAEKYTTIKKKTGDLDYNMERSPKTMISLKELRYCEYDILTLYEIIKAFKKEYKHLYNIPLTQTGEVRRDLRKRLDYFYFKDQQNYVPSYEIYKYLMQAFQGGITHANMIYTGKVWKNVYSADEASAYPTMILTKKYPCGKWCDYDIQDVEHMKDFKCFIFHIRLWNVKSKLFNHYLSSYKCIIKNGLYSDNGRILHADFIEIIITDVDFEMLKQSYTYDKIEYVRILGCNKKYLDKRILQYVLDLYKQKTELKGIEEQADFYMKAKQRINSIFGCACTSVLNQDTYYINNEWGRYCADEIKDTFMREKIEGLQTSNSNYFNYGVGVWITAYNRRALWTQIIKNDKDVIYYDTDSIKSIKEIDFTDYNNQIMQECIESAKENNLNIEDFAPLDKKGIKHQIGVFEIEPPALEFITLGAKKYCYRLDDGLHLTVSGVSKKAVTALNDDINNFKKNLIFDYDHAKKNMHYYTTQEPFTFTDIDDNTYTCTDEYGIVLQPTTYTLGITDEYEKILEMYGGII